MDIIVQKFGGTSVATEESRNKVMNHIIDIKKQGKKVVVVVSAIGRKGDPYATDTLLQFSKKIYQEMKPREMDLLMSCGEIISAVILSNTLNKNGEKSIVLTGGQAGILTDEVYGNSNVISVDPKKIYSALEEGEIPIICGFQGESREGNITTLGRGGSDTTASIIGEALSAEKIEIFTDVDGIMTTDPKICPEAKIIDEISYHEVFQMADAGAKVIHPRAVEIAMRANIPIVIKNTFSNSSGTLINGVSSMYSKEGTNKKSNHIITGIAYIPGKTQIQLETIEMGEDLFFTELGELGVSIDIINFLPDKKIFTISSHNIMTIIKLLEKYNIKYSMTENCCKITLIGERMAGLPGVMAKIIRTLSLAKVKILQTSDSHTTISCLILSNDVEKAISALHKEFNLNR